MRILGMDPSVNMTAYALIDSCEGLIDAAIVSNPYRCVGPVESLTKANAMCVALKTALEQVQEADLAIMEASCGTCVSVGDFIRMALVSGAGIGAANAKELVFVAPPTWKIVKEKERNHEIYFQTSSLEELNKLQAFADKYPKSKRHNLYDAFCIATWGMDKYNK